MEQDPDAPPNFWFQPPLTANRRRTPLIDPVVLIILLPIVALILLFFFLPPVLHHTSHILKPSSVKSTWDSLNIFLVLFAIICGVLARRNDDASFSDDVADQANSFVADSRNAADSSSQWVAFSDRKMVTGGLKRNSSSYPDLRQESLWENGENRSRFFDDFNVDMYSSPASRYYNHLSRRNERERESLYRSTPVSGDVRQRSRRSKADRGEPSEVKEIVVDTFEVSPNVPDFREQATVTPPSPPPPPPAVSANSRTHSFRSVGRNVNVEIPKSDELDKVRSYHHPPPTPPPPPPPPPPPLTEVRLQRSHHKHKKLERKVSDATKELATAISSLYNQKKKKSKRKLRNVSNSSGSSDTSPPSVHSIRSPDIQEPQQTVAPSPPPPPPPPPPPSMFQNLFKKGGKHKRIYSDPVTVPPTVPPPPPPPPPSSIFNNLFKSGNKSKRFHSPSTAPPPPQPPPPPSSIMNSLFKNGTKSKRFNSSKPASSPPTPPPLPPPMTPPRYTVPGKSKQISKRKNQAQPPSPPSAPKTEPRNQRSTRKGKPPLPAKTSSYYERDDFLPSGSQSPLIPLPPPPPPFRMPAMKFELRGDFVRIRSTHSSVCSSPDRDDVDLSSRTMDGGDLSGPGPIFFPSPDVNAKADSFISRLKDEWRMEKINSVKDKMG